ncbi:UNVERIFIED_CONTAM: hypothetical protein GTU68_039225 [Idotea baltica]|nr:hypothetical protein [Idotea baltica]
MIETSIDLQSALQQHFGFAEFKGNQEKIIQSILDGHDTFVIMPTGGGKSLCYQLPALMQSGTAIIVSPLIALMKNQVDSIRGHSQADEIAHFLNSSLNKTQIKTVKEDIVNGKTKLLFVAPETLTKQENIEFFKNVDVSFVAIDEAHCISEWGHDFRPEYRRIKTMIDQLEKKIAVVALTATATEKVRSDIIKNLEMDNHNEFISSFNRDNLYYEIRPKISKDETQKQIVQYIKGMANKSGIIYVQSRKSTEELAKVLQINGIKAAPYHAGLDGKTRSKVQDDFLMEEIDVICATIAFGMGIDKPDVRFVIHYDIPKSIENYYQETGRGGRDGLEGNCVAFYSYKDILKLEKFLRDKPVAEREMATQLLEEIIGYSETGACRRRYLLHYFGENYDDQKCGKKCDNCRHPKEKLDAKIQMQTALKAIDQLNENYGIKLMVDFLVGNKTQEILSYSFEKKDLFAAGTDQSEVYWHSILRNAILSNYVYKEIEQYGLLKLTDKGRAFIEKTKETLIAVNTDFTALKDDVTVLLGGGQSAALDTTLLKMLKDLRISLARSLKVPPFVIFQDPSLQDMATQYPISMQDMANISGVSLGKAKRYAGEFVKMIANYVEENEIERPTDFVIKQVADKSKMKINIIQAIDRKMPLEDMASDLNLSMDELLKEMDMIVSSGTKLNISYYINDIIDEEVRDEIVDYFMDSETDDIDAAINELAEDDITEEEIRIVRLNFLSKLAN